MTDQTRVNSLLSWVLTGSALPTVPAALRLRLTSAAGSNTANGTENVAATSPGYTAPSTVAITFGAASAGVCTSTNAPSWTATGTWTLGVAGCEIWDTAGTPLRWFQAALTTAIAASAVVNGDTVTFATGAVTVSGAAW
jgi:hypothetical protein